MADPQKSAVMSGVQAFYEQTLALSVKEMPDFDGPDFDDLTADQVRSWILAFVATAEVAVRTVDALQAIGMATHG